MIADYDNLCIMNRTRDLFFFFFQEAYGTIRMTIRVACVVDYLKHPHPF